MDPSIKECVIVVVVVVVKSSIFTKAYVVVVAVVKVFYSFIHSFIDIKTIHPFKYNMIYE